MQKVFGSCLPEVLVVYEDLPCSDTASLSTTAYTGATCPFFPSFGPPMLGQRSPPLFVVGFLYEVEASAKKVWLFSREWPLVYRTHAILKLKRWSHPVGGLAAKPRRCRRCESCWTSGRRRPSSSPQKSQGTAVQNLTASILTVVVGILKGNREVLRSHTFQGACPCMPKEECCLRCTEVLPV